MTCEFFYSKSNILHTGLFLLNGCCDLKSILVVATGIVIGDLNQDSPAIVNFIRFDQDETPTEETLQQFLTHNNHRIRESLAIPEEEIITEVSQVVDFLRLSGYKNARYANPGELVPLRSLVSQFLQTQPQAASPTTLVREKALALTRSRLQEQVETRDRLVAQAVNSVDDVNEILNLLYSRVVEWYGLHFPEVKDLVRDINQYIKLVAKIGNAQRSELDESHLEHLSDRRQELILEAAQNSLGSPISEFDLLPISQLAQFGVEIIKIKESLEAYIEESMTEVAPNIQSLVGSNLGARLIALSGSLESLAKSSSGTLQVLGAEKALFRHLRSGEDPPKHGVIFQSPYIHTAKRHQRGKIARTLAGKLSIASRVDYFNGEFVGQTLLHELEKRIEEIKISSPEPSERQLTRKRETKRKKRQFRGKSEKRGYSRGRGSKSRRRPKKPNS
jgi:nucleolar protein 56